MGRVTINGEPEHEVINNYMNNGNDCNSIQYSTLGGIIKSDSQVEIKTPFLLTCIGRMPPIPAPQ